MCYSVLEGLKATRQKVKIIEEKEEDYGEVFIAYSILNVSRLYYLPETKYYILPLEQGMNISINKKTTIQRLENLLKKLTNQYVESLE